MKKYIYLIYDDCKRCNIACVAATEIDLQKLGLSEEYGRFLPTCYDSFNGKTKNVCGFPILKPNELKTLLVNQRQY